MTHLIPFYLFACFLAGVAAFAVMIALIRKFPGNGFTWIAVFIAGMSLSILGNLYRMYRALAIDASIGMDTYVISLAMLAMTSVQFMSVPLFLHRYLRLAFRRVADTAVLLLGTSSAALSLSPLSLEYRGDEGVLLFRPGNIAGQFANLAMLIWCIVLLRVIFRHHPDPRARRALRNIFALTLAFLPGFVRDLLYFGAAARMDRQPVLFAFYPLYFGILSVGIALHGLKRTFAPDEERDNGGALSIDPCLLSRFGLTEKECEIIPLVLSGEGNKQIAHALGISVKTVNNHLYNIYRKMGINSRFELIPLLSPSKRVKS